MRKTILFVDVDNAYIFECPHCDGLIQVLVGETACCIFRHATYIHNMEQVDPHMPESKCKQLINNGLIIGCGKPFKLVREQGEIAFVEECGYL